MIWLSEILLRGHDLATFAALAEAVREEARAGGRFLRMDVRPPFGDTPDDWEERLEAAFTGNLDDHR